MAKTYYGQTSGGTHPPTEAAKLTAPPASGSVRCLIYMGPTRGNEWNYSGVITGSLTTTLYVVDNGPTLGRERSTT
jgi:hypothetical protein